MKETSHDVLVLGAGLAGLTAARETTAKGLDVAVVEASDRLGGRTFGREWAPHGLTLDMGGTWILPSFAASAAEIERYGLPTYRNDDPAWGCWSSTGSSGAWRRPPPRKARCGTFSGACTPCSRAARR